MLSKKNIYITAATPRATSNLYLFPILIYASIGGETKLLLCIYA
jgi:hypothetical protein